MCEVGQGSKGHAGDGYREAIERPVDPVIFERAFRSFVEAEAEHAPVPGAMADTELARGLAAAGALLADLAHPEDDRLGVLYRLMLAGPILEHPALAKHIDVERDVSAILLMAMATIPCRLDQESAGFDVNELLRQVEYLAVKLRAA